MKMSILCLLVLALCATSGALARRDLKASASANAVAVSTGGSATSLASASGAGATANTATVAKDGAEVEATTIAESKDNAKVEATTVAVGEGPNADSSTTTVVKSDKDVSVGRFVARVSDGETVETVANDLVIVFENYANAAIVKVFKDGFSGDAKHVDFFVKTLELFVEKRGCDQSKIVFKGEEIKFLAYKLPVAFSKCLYSACSGVDSAKSCCGKSQLKQTQCSCSGGKCLWEQPKNPAPFLKYWNCQGCGETISYCVCY